MHNSRRVRDLKRACGTKQVLKAIENGSAVRVFLARDVDLYISDKIKSAAEDRSVPIVFVDTMDEIGKMCGIKVGSATMAEIS